MNILFTKNIELPPVFTNSEFSVDFLELISIKTLKTKSFDLKNASLIFTSSNGVKAFFENGFKPSEDFTSRKYNRIYCVGEKTKKELRKNGFGVFKVLKNAKELSEFIIDNCAEEKFIHFCGNLALDVLDEELALQNIKYKKVVVYHTQELYPTTYEKYHAIVFFSPSGVRSFAKNNSLDGSMLFSIGNTTTEELKKFTENTVHTSTENNLKDVLELLLAKISL